MTKSILEAVATVTLNIHKKKLAKTRGITRYEYGHVALDSPKLTPYLGKKVKVIIEKAG
jgi:hypothetical protein